MSFHLPMTVPVFCYLRFKQSGMLEVTGATIITICHLGGILSLIMARRVICVHMPTMKETEYESATACGLALGIH